MTQFTHFLRSRWRKLAGLSILAGLLAGCGGTIRGHIVSQNMTNIRVEPTDAKSVRLDANECYWWVDEAGRVNIAGKGVKKSLLGGREQEFAISFTLGEPSQGVGKDYSLQRGKLLGYIKTHGNIYRFQNIYGILGSENRERDRIVAAYRCSVQLQGAGLLGGWSGPVLFLTYGTLKALPDSDGRGAAIQSEIVENYFDRPGESPSPAKNKPDRSAFSIFDD
jgi:hypothetical protein